MDLTPHIFKTTDYGKKWKRITDGIEGEHTFVRVVREDPIRKDLFLLCRNRNRIVHKYRRRSTMEFISIKSTCGSDKRLNNCR